MINSTENHLDETLLEGHLGITRELLAFQSADKKYHIGSEKGGANLIKVEYVQYFLNMLGGLRGQDVKSIDIITALDHLIIKCLLGNAISLPIPSLSLLPFPGILQISN